MKITLLAAILTSRFVNLNDGHNGYRRWFACFKDRSFVVFSKYQGKALKFLLLFASYTSSVDRIYGRVVRRPKMKVGNHPSHNAIVTADLHVAKT